MGSLTKQVLVFCSCASLNIYLGRIFRRQHNSRIVSALNGLQRSAVRCVDPQDSALQLSGVTAGLAQRLPGCPAAGAREGTRGHPYQHPASCPSIYQGCPVPIGAGIQLGAPSPMAVLLDTLLLCFSALFLEAFIGRCPSHRRQAVVEVVGVNAVLCFGRSPPCRYWPRTEIGPTGRWLRPPGGWEEVSVLLGRVWVLWEISENAGIVVVVFFFFFSSSF